MTFDASELLKFEQNYDLSYDEQARKTRADFLKAYPVSELKELSLNNYIIGKSSPSFCTWVEAKTKLWANILGATSFKFGIYYGKTKSDPTQKYRFSKKFGDPAKDEPQEAFQNIKKALLKLIRAGEEKNFQEIDENSLSSLFKAKILSLYFPNVYINICSPEHLGHFAQELGLSGQFNSEIQHLLVKEKQNHETTRSWSNPKFMTFLYTKYLPEHLKIAAAEMQSGDASTREKLSLREALLKILRGYKSAEEEEFIDHPMADFLRHGLPESIKYDLPDPDEFSIKGSAGQSTWTRSPWAAVFDLQITDSAQRGYYPAFLFREDLSGVYLSLNQGMTEIKESYKSDAKEALRSRAEDFRARLGKVVGAFNQSSIDLKPATTSSDSAFYEAGNIIAKFYPINDVPDEAILKSDLHEILVLYKRLIYGDPALTESQNLEDDEQDHQFFEDLRSFRIHKRIERNYSLAQKVKKIQGYTCKACGFNYEEKYRKIGKDYIEAHHLEPISELKGQRVQRDPKKDFTVLCADCHRMIHRSEFVNDPESFRKKYLIQTS